jgi:N-acetyltransferase 10
LKENLRDTPPAGPLVNLCRTHDQAKAVAQFIDALAEKQLKLVNNFVTLLQDFS